MPEAEASPEKSEAKPEPKQKAGGGLQAKLVPAMTVLNSVLLAAVLALVVLRTGGAHRAPAAEKGEEPAAEHASKGEKPEKEKGDGKGKGPALPGPTLRLPDFVIHLRDADAERYARVSFEMEVPDEKGKEALTLRMPQIRDAFLTYLSDRSAEELRGSDAIGRVKLALAQRIADVAPGAPVRNLYITELIVQ